MTKNDIEVMKLAEKVSQDSVYMWSRANQRSDEDCKCILMGKYQNNHINILCMELVELARQAF